MFIKFKDGTRLKWSTNIPEDKTGAQSDLKLQKNYSGEASWDIADETLKNNKFPRNKSPEKRLKELKTLLNLL